MTHVILRALANPVRLEILCLLGRGELSVNDINQKVGLSQSALSQHLAKLREVGLVSTRRVGQTIFYQVADARIQVLAESMADLLQTVVAETRAQDGARPSSSG